MGIHDIWTDELGRDWPLIVEPEPQPEVDVTWAELVKEFEEMGI